MVTKGTALWSWRVSKHHSYEDILVRLFRYLYLRQVTHVTTSVEPDFQLHALRGHLHALPRLQSSTYQARTHSRSTRHSLFLYLSLYSRTDLDVINHRTNAMPRRLHGWERVASAMMPLPLHWPLELAALRPHT